MKNIKDLTILGIMTAIIIVMVAVPGLGYIPIGIMNATIVHIPVIILAIVKGPKLGALLGLVFGITSILNAILRPVITSYIFMNPLVAVLPRVLIGLGTGYIFIALDKMIKNKGVSIGISAAIGSMINTIGVLSLVFILYGRDFLEKTGRSSQTIVGALFTIAGTQGVVEMIVSVVISIPIAYALLRTYKRGKNDTIN
ncbi:ECF transporter S component [Helcococcus kunzii]|uniref:ECF transporter S component n=1 Tax=Helcococcus kunzii ATCC 51366 TaxID=883114 RepID=H3NNM3_9FIRM|nr:ECF transporter S component [Helcococcus kunzii]EHR33998.1 hypothetical protein HMPREF9709_00934 [Helcococcus kunzii ATCC 51366]MCT1795606.1 ECF transporter S component [Helcococcus kunzii]MCT1988828.1 ECF transporter S component [Helcococcus kunzii]